MKTQIIALLLAAVLPPAAQASPPQPTRLVIDCARPALPTQREVARFTGVDNFSQLYVTRAHLMTQARRECRRGAGRVELVQTLPVRDGAPVQRLADLTQATR